MELWTVKSDVVVTCDEKGYITPENLNFDHCTFINVHSINDFKEALTKCVKKESVGKITLQSSYILELPADSFDNFTSLMELDANGLSMTKITEAFKSPERGHPFEKIDMYNNSLTYIDELTFQTLETLKILNLEFNHIESIHEKAFEKTKLNQLILSNNRLQNIIFLNHIPKIIDLDLSFNNIGGHLHRANTFSNLNTLKKLNLSSIGFSRIPVFGLFSPLLNLENLDLSKNGIKNLNIIALYSMSNLRYLDLSNNKIRDIHHVLKFKHVFPEIERIDLSGNEILCHQLVDYFLVIENVNTKIVSKAVDYDRPNVKGVRCLMTNI